MQRGALSQALASVDGALLPAGLADADAARLFESGQLSSGVPGAALGSYACGAAGRTASLDGLDAEQLARVVAGGGMPVVLGADGRPVWGPSGEPVVVGPAWRSSADDQAQRGGGSVCGDRTLMVWREWTRDGSAVACRLAILLRCSVEVEGASDGVCIACASVCLQAWQRGAAGC